MGCNNSSSKVSSSSVQMVKPKNTETVASALTRLHEAVAAEEQYMAGARLSIVSMEIEGIQQEITTLESFTQGASPIKNEIRDEFHKIFTRLGLYNNHDLAAENEDFIGNINRKEMRRLELAWLRKRLKELQKEKGELTERIKYLQSLYLELQMMLEQVNARGGSRQQALEKRVAAAHAQRDTLAAAAQSTRVAAHHAADAARHADDALLVWKMVPLAKNGLELTGLGADACAALVRARCAERGARRALRREPAAPRAARALRLAADYMMTDLFNSEKHKKTTEVFQEFQQTVTSLIQWVNKVQLSNFENLAVSENEIKKYESDLKFYRINLIAKKGLTELIYRQPQQFKSRTTVKK